MTVRAIYENGVFRPTEKGNLPDRCEVEVEVRHVKVEPSTAQTPMSEGLAKVYEILSRRRSSGCMDAAASHNEHQP